ncbi:MAG: hypothetical protein V2A78_07520 [bacterium]
MKKKSETAVTNEIFKKDKNRLLKSINLIYEEANILSRRKNEEEEALQELSETKASLLRAALKEKSDPLSLSEMLTDSKKMQKILAKLGDKKIRREIEQVEREITRRRTNVEKFELLKKSVEKEMSLKLDNLFKELNELNSGFYSRLMREKDDSYRLVKKQIAELEDTEKILQEEILECKLALKFEEKPKELFKWW